MKEETKNDQARGGGSTSLEAERATASSAVIDSMPWRVLGRTEHGDYYHVVVGQDGEQWIASAFDLEQCLGVGGSERAAFIVRACNSYDALLTALRALVAADDSKSLAAIVDAIPAARAAIAKAEGR